MHKFQRNIYVLFLIRTIAALHFDRGIFILYLLYSGLTHGEVATLQILIFVVMMLMEVPSGLFADSYGRKASIVLAIISLCLYAIGMLFAEDFWLFFILFAIQGTGFAFYSGADTAMLYDSLKAMHREKSFVKVNSKLMMANNLALALGIGLGGFLQEWGGWTLVYLSYFAVLTTALFIAQFFIEPPYDEAHREGAYEGYGQKIRELRQIFADGKLTPILYFVGAIGVFEAMIIPLYIYSQELLAERGLQISQISLVYGVIEIIAALSFLLAPILLRKLGAKRFLQLAMIFSGLCVAFLAVDFVVVNMALLFAMFSWPEARRPIQESYFNARIPSNIRASLISLDSMIVCIMTAITYGYYAIAQSLIPLGWVMAMSASLCVVALILLQIYFRNELPELAD